MSLRHARLTAALALLLASMATAANSAVLWDQSAIDFGVSAPGIINSQLNGFGGGPYFTVNDVTVPAAGWTVTLITQYYSDYTFANMQIKAPTGYLMVFPKTGSLPGISPTLTTVPLTWTQTTISGQPIYVMTASVNEVLTAGDYWITVSPIQTVDTFNGNNQQWPALNHAGADCATHNSGASWSNFYPGYDSAFKLEGAVGGATPTASQSWGGLKALYR